MNLICSIYVLKNARLLSSLLLSPEMTLLGTEANVDVEHLNYIDATVDIQGLSSLSRDAVDDIVNSLPIVNEPTILNALDTNITAGTIQKAVNKGWIVFFTSSDGNVYNTYDNPEIIPTAISSAVAEDVPLVFYNLQGRRLNVSPAKGFYIKGGRKYVVK